MVPGTGFEPAHLSAYAPKAYVSTNSTIRAYPYYNTLSPTSESFTPRFCEDLVLCFSFG